MKSKKPIVVTGAAGFIGAHLCEALLKRGDRVYGFDALTPYNDPELKKRRLAFLKRYKGFKFTNGTIADKKGFDTFIAKVKPRVIAHLAAQAGVRYSLENPQSYVEANVLGSTNVFEAARKRGIPVVYASSSSVYGERTGTFTEKDETDNPVSIYAATKKATEALASAYHTLYGVPMIGLRYFTVYGPWMRTDLALFKFARLLLEKKAIPLFARGEGMRSFTHISFVVDGTIAAIDRVKSGHTIYNIGDERTIKTKEALDLLSNALGVTPKVSLLPKQKGDVMYTKASSKKAMKDLRIKPSIPIEKGIREFAAWFKENEKLLLSLKDMHST